MRTMMSKGRIPKRLVKQRSHETNEPIAPEVSSKNYP